MESTDADVLVVGAGPVGLFAAADLASRGIKVRIIDKLSKPQKITKASGIQLRTMELLPNHVVKKILKSALRIACVRVSEHTLESSSKVDTILTVDLEGQGDTWSGIFDQEQWKTEELLTQYLNSLGVKVERCVELQSFKDKGDFVCCEVKTPESTQLLTVKYLLGCDGGRSTVRKKLNLSFDGHTQEESYVALHCKFENFSWGERSMDIYLSRGSGSLMAPGFALSIPMPGDTYLVVYDLSETQFAPWRTGQVNKYGVPLLRDPSPEEAIEALRTRGCGNNLRMVPNSLRWLTHFRINSRMIEHYSSGRVHLAGDACHCHSPVGGQGMNMGIQDARNLTWKLAMVIKGRAAHGGPLLRSYESERKGVDQRILRAIEKAEDIAESRSALVFLIRGALQRFIATLPSMAGPLSRAMGMQIYSYNDRELAVEHWERPPILPFPLSRLHPAGGYRRRQNIRRWLGTRIRAGDRMPNFTLSTGKKAYPYESGWMLLLFEGQRQENQAMLRNLRHGSTVILDASCLRTFGEKFMTMNLVDCVHVFPSHHTAHTSFGVQGQCLYLVRPDGYIGLRSEPIRSGAILQYFSKTIGVPNLPKEAYPISSPSWDWFPIAAHTVIWSSIAILLFSGGTFFGLNSEKLKKWATKRLGL